MAGLFGGPKAGAAGTKHGFNWGDAAMGFFGVPPSTLIARRQKEREAEAALAQQKQVEGMIDNDPSLPTPEAKMYAKANPDAYIKAYMTRYQTFQFPASGGSTGRLGAGGAMEYQMAPSRHEFQGSVYDVGAAAPGQQATVTPQHQGTQWVTPQTGTQAFPVNSFTGVERGGAAPSRPLTDDEIRQLDAQGGAGPAAAPRTFPFGF